MAFEVILLSSLCPGMYVNWRHTITVADPTKKIVDTGNGTAMSLALFGRQYPKGNILKAERMLVRIERIDNKDERIPEEYNESTSIKTRLKRPWREYYVVARAGKEDFKHVILHIHKSRACLILRRFWS